MKTTKKLLALILAMLMVVSLLAGCGAKTDPTASDVTPPAADVPKEDQEAEEPAEPAEPIVLDIIGNTGGWVAQQNTPVELMVEERFNVEMNVAEVDSWQADTTAVYLAGSPDFDYIAANASFADYSSWYEQGLLRTFTYEELWEHMPNWMAALEKDVGENGKAAAEISRKMIEDGHNGELFTIPTCEGQGYYIMAVRQDWLDNLGLEVPKTFEELVAVMEAFTYDDPDGNGIDDTYGIDCHYNYRLNYLHLMDGVVQDCFSMDDNGNVVYMPATDAWKTSLKRAAEVYAKGVIDPEFATDSRAIVREKWASGKFGVTVDATSWFADTNSGNILNLVKQNDPNAELTYLDPLPSADGNSYVWAVPIDYNILPAGAFGANCTDEQMYKMMEILDTVVADFDFMLSVKYGEEGKDWNYSDLGVVTATPECTPEVKQEMGYGMLYRLTAPKGDNADKLLSQMVLDLYDQYSKYTPVTQTTNFSFSGANEAYSTYFADVQTLETEYYYKAIMGNVDIDATWDDHVAAMNAAGLQEIIDEYQAYVDANLK